MVLGPLLVDVGIGLQDSLKPLAGVGSLVAHFGQMEQVSANLALVPGSEDRLHIRKVFVQRRPADTGLLGDLRHRHRRRPLF